MSFYLADKTTSWKHVKGHLYYVADNFCVDLTAMFGEGNEPCEENDERIKELLTAKKYVSYDEKTIIFSNLSWMNVNKDE